jgi:DNA-binding CsgD family transcriptional regulator
MNSMRTNLLELVALGVINRAEIARRLGVSHRTVRRHVDALREQGYDIPDHDQRSVSEDSVLELIKAGHSNAEAGAMLGISARQVQRIRSALIQAGNLERTREYTPPIEPAKLEQARGMLEDRSGYAEAAKTLGIDAKNLARRFPNMGLTPQESGARSLITRQFSNI